MAAAYRAARGGATLPVAAAQSGDGDEPWDVEQTEVESLDLSEITGCPDKFACVIHGALTPGECEELISRSEHHGYTAALINAGKQQLRIADVRNNDRAIIDDPVTAEFLYQRVLQALARCERQKRGVAGQGKEMDKKKGKGWGGWFGGASADSADAANSSLLARLHSPSFQHGRTAVGLNERLRFLRYDTGTFFAPHFDGQYVRDEKNLGSADRRGEWYALCCLLVVDGERRY